MDVYLVPVGADRYELYCESETPQPVESDEAAPSSWWRRRVDSFRAMIEEAEAERDRRASGEPGQSRGLWRFVVGKIAEAVAEQRLLWLLRGQERARLFHPDLITGESAMTTARDSLRRDFEKHRRWMIIDALIFLLFVPLTIIPGPNLPALYFTFRAVGHFFSMRGARHGLQTVEWTQQPSAELTALQNALVLEPAERHPRIEKIGEALGLERLPAFVERLMGVN